MEFCYQVRSRLFIEITSVKTLHGARVQTKVINGGVILVLHEFERYIGFYRLRVTSIPETKDRIPLTEAMGQLNSLYEADNAYWIHERGLQSVRLLDFQEHPEYYILLVSLTKIDIADPAFEHILTGEYRVEEKAEGEGISYSAHMLIYKNEETVHAGISHRVAIEKVPGISSTVIRPFLTALLKAAYEANPMVYWYRNENRLYRPRFTLNGDLATTLGQEMGRGRITGLELIDHRDQVSGLDEQNILIEKKAVLTLKVEGEHDANRVIQSINNIKARARGNNFDEVKIKVTRDDTGEQTIPLSIDLDMDASETLAVRKEIVRIDDVSTPLGQRHASIRDDLVELIHGIPDVL